MRKDHRDATNGYFITRNSTIIADSENATKVLQGLYRSLTNVALVNHVQDLLAQASTNRRIMFKHVQGHGADHWNNAVDHLADLGRSQTSRINNIEEVVRQSLHACIEYITQIN